MKNLIRKISRSRIHLEGSGAKDSSLIMLNLFPNYVFRAREVYSLKNNETSELKEVYSVTGVSATQVNLLVVKDKNELTRLTKLILGVN